MATQQGMKKYMKGALLLTLAALFVKILSAIYRVPYQNLVGDEGFYVYQQVYPFISIFVVWTTGGFAVAISKMLAHREQAAERRALSRIIFSYMTVLSLVFFAVLFFGAQTLAQWMGDDMLAPLLQTGAFVTLCMPTLALLKGSFQGKGLMAPVAYAQVFEQLVRVIVILGGTVIIMQTSRSIYAAGNMAVFGTVVGEIAAVLLLLAFMRKERQVAKTRVHIPVWPTIKEVTLFSISVSLSSLMLLGFQLVDSFTIYTTLLNSGMATGEAMVQKGIYDRGQPLVQLGVVIASSLSLAIVPLIAQKLTTAGRGALPFVQLTYRTALLFGSAAAVGLTLTMPYVNELLFKTSELSAVLIVIVLHIIPFSLILTFTAILQGYGHLTGPALSVTIGFVIKWLSNLWLLPRIGIIGAAVASNLGLFISAIFLMLYVKRIVNTTLAERKFYAILAAALIAMSLAVKGSASLLAFAIGASTSRGEAALYVCVLVAIGAAVFMTIIAKGRILKERDWFLIPFGRRIALYQLWLNRRK